MTDDPDQTARPDFGAYIARGTRAQRALLAIDQAELARRLGWSAQTVSDLERGRRKVIAADLPRLCEALGCTLAELAVAADPADLRFLGL